ncbi:HlyC/CorC family transporter [Wenzhouxiangella sp. XN79A]|uniref:HlyC/CorC family transporter n=1 Tax=Wenzhouxiangella sp. XN79A TaxID=2724193 RepID=UPI00144A8C2C|nr:HlyC/CorC family transporter [Wenzhouxiangella sp. XN79A]NKI34386.1 HlyC/CorC family transporter [Wenzhouxiangella sp. XN79A]
MNELSTGTLLLILLVLIVLSAFFSSSETGLVALNRYRMRHQAKGGHRGAALAQRLLGRPERMFGLILLGNNLVNILAASISTLLFLKLLGDGGIWVSTLVLTAVILIFAEVAPKTLAATHPERIAYPASYILVPLLKVLYPFVWIINVLASAVLRPFGVKRADPRADQLTREELRTLVKEDGRQISLNHRQMLLNILDLEYGTIDDVMVPRQDIVGIDLDEDWETLLHQLTRSIYTRLPVWRGDIDNLIGLLHIRTVMVKLSQGTLTPTELERSIRTPYYIPEGTPLTQQLLEFQSRERRMGMVVDEYGDIQGLVTLDDILEEIVGEYTSEGTGRARQLRKLDDGSWIVSANTTVRMLNRRMEWDLPTSGAKTLNGLILEQLESLPDGHTSIRVGDHILTIVDMADNRVRKVLFKPWRMRRDA